MPPGSGHCGRCRCRSAKCQGWLVPLLCPGLLGLGASPLWSGNVVGGWELGSQASVLLPGLLWPQVLLEAIAASPHCYPGLLQLWEGTGLSYTDKKGLPHSAMMLLF